MKVPESKDIRYSFHSDRSEHYNRLPVGIKAIPHKDSVVLSGVALGSLCAKCFISLSYILHSRSVWYITWKDQPSTDLRSNILKQNELGVSVLKFLGE